MSKEEILGALRQARIHNPLHQPSYTHVDSMVYDRNDLFNVYLQYQKANMANVVPVSYTHLTLPTRSIKCRSRWSPYH